MARPDPPDQSDALGPLQLEARRYATMNLGGIGCGLFMLGWAFLGLAMMLGWVVLDLGPTFRVALGAASLLMGLGTAWLVLRQVLSNLDLLVRVHERGLVHRVRGRLNVLRFDELTDLRRTENNEFTLAAGDRVLRIEALGTNGDSFGALLANALLALRNAELEAGKTADFGALTVDAAGVHAGEQLFAWDELALEVQQSSLQWELRSRDGARKLEMPLAKIHQPDVLFLILMQRGVVQAPHPQTQA